MWLLTLVTSSVYALVCQNSRVPPALPNLSARWECGGGEIPSHSISSVCEHTLLGVGWCVNVKFSNLSKKEGFLCRCKASSLCIFLFFSPPHAHTMLALTVIKHSCGEIAKTFRGGLALATPGIQSLSTHHISVPHSNSQQVLFTSKHQLTYNYRNPHTSNHSNLAIFNRWS